MVLHHTYVHVHSYIPRYTLECKKIRPNLGRGKPGDCWRGRRSGGGLRPTARQMERGRAEVWGLLRGRWSHVGRRSADYCAADGAKSDGGLGPTTRQMEPGRAEVWGLLLGR